MCLWVHAALFQSKGLAGQATLSTGTTVARMQAQRAQPHSRITALTPPGTACADTPVQEENARAALLLEQSAYCLLYCRPPAPRKFAFQVG